MLFVFLKAVRIKSKDVKGAKYDANRPIAIILSDRTENRTSNKESHKRDLSILEIFVRCNCITETIINTVATAIFNKTPIAVESLFKSRSK